MSALLLITRAYVAVIVTLHGVTVPSSHSTRSCLLNGLLYKCHNTVQLKNKMSPQKPLLKKISQKYKYEVRNGEMAKNSHSAVSYGAAQ